MYKVFFNSRTINLLDNQPGPEEALYENFVTFRDIRDLESRINKWLKSEDEGDLNIWHKETDRLMDYFSSCFTIINASGGLVKNNKGEDLIIFRRGVWDLPKGKAEPGESPEQTALREVGEECHLKDLKIKRFLINTYHIYFIDDTPVLKETQWFEIIYEGKKSPRPQKNEDITKTIWLPFNKLNLISGNTFPNVLEVINAGQRSGKV
jgi:ADP-ribose pyrophosphatase YjhB (NUDIX family)